MFYPIKFWHFVVSAVLGTLATGCFALLFEQGPLIAVITAMAALSSGLTLLIFMALIGRSARSTTTEPSTRDMRHYKQLARECEGDDFAKIIRNARKSVT
jgi:hypothetical protein